jgi:hypothetical protein
MYQYLIGPLAIPTRHDIAAIPSTEAQVAAGTSKLPPLMRGRDGRTSRAVTVPTAHPAVPWGWFPVLADKSLSTSARSGYVKGSLCDSLKHAFKLICGEH